MENRVAVGVFADRAQAELAVQKLRAAGVPDDHIGMLVRDDQGRTEELPALENPDSVQNGAKAGLVAGGVLGGVLGTSLSFIIPGGAAIMGSILATTLGGAAFGAAAGGMIALLVQHGVPEEEARYYDSEFQSGRTIVIVQADEYPQTTFAILKQNQLAAGSANERTPGEDPEATLPLPSVQSDEQVERR